MQCLRRCLATLLATGAVLAGGVALALYLAPRWLNDPDVPEKAAAILVLGGDPTRALEAADLFQAGYAPKVYISAPVRDPYLRRLDALGITMPREEDITRRILVMRGVPDAAIDLLGRELLSTAHEARLAQDRLGGVGVLLVVTSPYHVQRARMIFRRAMPPTVRTLIVGNRHESLPDAWWKDQATSRNVVLELVKTLFYLAGGRFSRSAP